MCADQPCAIAASQVDALVAKASGLTTAGTDDVREQIEKMQARIADAQRLAVLANSSPGAAVAEVLKPETVVSALGNLGGFSW